MLLAKLSPIFTLIIIAIVYMIIFTALRIMNKDIKGGTRKKSQKKAAGLEIIEPGNSYNLKRGGVIPLKGQITIGRKEDNTFMLDDPYVSAKHARIYAKSGDYIIEDLGSTNGTLVNDGEIEGKKYLETGDIIKIGNTVLKFLI
ncbi:pSer/pThr/pTyr-binding forkhead associated (FHA) protein [Clostridium pascui]|uniref:FHA domain-containing protein n=1 Tax=Clostridium pascui TaxID=46609 RepID=UPI00195DC687|nr:FHA domain-containing protein [Clostridium pascui]MBM7869721.1 pSer/pThr/pTyr-binding forkhead associated (FHA) protein [Clostridium pascui]